MDIEFGLLCLFRAETKPVILSWGPYDNAEIRREQPLSIIEPMTGLNLIDGNNANVNWNHIRDHANEVLNMMS